MFLAFLIIINVGHKAPWHSFFFIHFFFFKCHYMFIYFFCLVYCSNALPPVGLIKCSKSEWNTLGCHNRTDLTNVHHTVRALKNKNHLFNVIKKKTTSLNTSLDFMLFLGEAFRNTRSSEAAFFTHNLPDFSVFSVGQYVHWGERENKRQRVSCGTDTALMDPMPFRAGCCAPLQPQGCPERDNRPIA